MVKFLKRGAHSLLWSTFLVVLVNEHSFDVTNVAHYVIVLLVALLLTGLIGTAVLLLQDSLTRQLTRFAAWWRGFAERPMNLLTTLQLASIVLVTLVVSGVLVGGIIRTIMLTSLVLQQFPASG